MSTRSIIARAKGDGWEGGGRDTFGRTIYTKQVRLDLTVAEWAYLAGIIDGEGSLSMTNRGRSRRLDITQNGMVLHDWLKTRLPCGHVQSSGVGRQTHAFRITQQQGVYAVLRGTLPYLVVKRAKAEEFVRYLAERHGWE